jgi:hypothetical protein
LFSKSIRTKPFSAHVRWCEHGAPIGLGGVDKLFLLW